MAPSPKLPATKAQPESAEVRSGHRHPHVKFMYACWNQALDQISIQIEDVDQASKGSRIADAAIPVREIVRDMASTMSSMRRPNDGLVVGRLLRVSAVSLRSLNNVFGQVTG